MTALEVEWKLSLEFDNFSNLDLFQRGCYQVRCRYKGPPSLQYAFHLATDVQQDSMRGDYLCGASILNDGAVFATSVVNVQYRKEEFSLNEVATATLTAQTDSTELPHRFTLPHLQLVVDLLFCDGYSQCDVSRSLQVVCSRVVDMHFNSSHNVHHRIPLVFDYFHLANVSFTVHGVLSSVRSTLQSPSLEKSWFHNLFSSQPEQPLESTLPKVLFGDFSHKRKKRLSRKASSQAKYEVLHNDLDHARAVHKKLCAVLLSSLDGLVSSFTYLMDIIPQRQRLTIALPDKASRLDSLMDGVKSCDDASVMIAAVERDLDNLHAEINFLWTQYTEAVSLNPSIIRAMAEEHDRQTMNRLYEASIIHRWPLETCSRLSPKGKFSHSRIADAIRRSQYIELAVAPLQLTCTETDGECTSMPIIFEDRYDVQLPIGQKRTRHLSAPPKCETTIETPPTSSVQLRPQSQHYGSDVQHPSLRHRIVSESRDDSAICSWSHRESRNCTLDPLPVNGSVITSSKSNGHMQVGDSLDGTSQSSQATDETRSQEVALSSEELSARRSLQSRSDMSDTDPVAVNGVGESVCGCDPQAVCPADFNAQAASRNISLLSQMLLPPDLADIDWSSLPAEIVQEIMEAAANREEAEPSAVAGSSCTLPNGDEATDEDCQEDSHPVALRQKRHWSPSSRDKCIEPAKGRLREMLSINGCFLSDLPNYSSERVLISSPITAHSFLRLRQPTHVIVCVHGLEGNSNDLRSFRVFLEMAMRETRVDFIMSEVNQSNTFADFNIMTDNFIQELFHHLEAFKIQFDRISFIGHSLGNIIIRCALSRRAFRPLVDRLHTFLSLSGPHLGMLYHTNSIVSTGMWVAQKWKKSESLAQLALRDHSDPRQTFLYRLNQNRGLSFFKNVLLVSSVQDHYVPFHSARIEMCKPAVKDTSDLGAVYREMVHNALQPMIEKRDINLVRYNVIHHLPSRNADTIIGRAAHIAMLDSELFIQKFVFANCVKYFL